MIFYTNSTCRNIGYPSYEAAMRSIELPGTENMTEPNRRRPIHAGRGREAPIGKAAFATDASQGPGGKFADRPPPYAGAG